jgi:hypothetical protein
MFPLLTLPPRPRSAYNPDRLASDLIKTQVRHAQGVEERLPRAQQSGMAINLDTLTEGQAAAYLEHITRISHPAGAPKAPPPPKPRRRAKLTRRAKPTRRPKAPRRPKPTRRPATRRPVSRRAKIRRSSRRKRTRKAGRSRG